MTKLKNCAKGGVFIVPSNSAIIWRFQKFCFARNIGAFWKLWFARNYLCPPMGYLLSPPTRQVLGIVGSFGLHVIICALRWGIYCPLQLAPPTWQFIWRFFGSFVLRVIFSALRFRVFIVPSNLRPPTRHFFGDFWKFCLARNYLCPPILWSLLCSSCCSSSMCLLFYP